MNLVVRVVSVALFFFPVQCGCDKQEPANRTHKVAEVSVTPKSIEEVLAEHTPEWMAIPGVIGTGIGESNGRPCITVLVTQTSDTLSRRIPKDVEGYRVRIEVTGEIRAH